MTISNEQYDATVAQIMLLGSLVRSMPLGDVIRRAESADAVGPLFVPSHWIAGNEKLRLVLNLAKALHAFQAALPSQEEAERMDRDSARLAKQLGL